jgi:hypothetical protein
MSKKPITSVDPEIKAALDALWTGEANLLNVHTSMMKGKFHLRVEVEVEFGLETSQAMFDGLLRHVKEKIAKRKEKSDA